MKIKTFTKTIPLLISLLIIGPLQAEDAQYRDYPLERVDLATEVPHKPDDYTYTVTGTSGGVEYYAEAVPLVDLSDSRMSELSKIPVGTVVQLTSFRSFRGRNFFAIPIEATVAQGESARVGWLDGRYIRIAPK